MDKIVSIDNLIRLRMVIVNMCSMCLSDGESGAHLFIDCPFASLPGMYGWWFLYVWIPIRRDTGLQNGHVGVTTSDTRCGVLLFDGTRCSLPYPLRAAA